MWGIHHTRGQKEWMMEEVNSVILWYKGGGLGWSACSVTQSCLTLWYLLDCSPPGSSCPWDFFQARILEWVSISFSRVSSGPKDQTCISCVSCIAGGFFYPLSHQRNPGLIWILSKEKNHDYQPGSTDQRTLSFSLTFVIPNVSSAEYLDYSPVVGS